MSTRYVAMLGGCAAVLALACGGSAQAQLLPPGGHFYLGGEAGWSHLEDQSVSSPAGSGTASFDDGYALGVRGGYQMGPWRLEEEYIYHRNDLDSATAGGASIPGVSGHSASHAIMTNLLYDFDLGWPVTPHIGVGVGAVDVVNDVRVAGIGKVVDDDSWQFGYQAIAGASYYFNPNLSLDVDYRYLATTDPSFHITAAAGGGTYKTGYSTQNVLASLIYHFTPPPPPPPLAPTPAAAPAPPPPPARQVFLVFFDWDRADITPQGMQIIQQAANAYKSGAPVQLQVTGYTDRSGSASYNQRLSERRANNVANALLRDGVPRDQMAVSGRGENDNRVPTANGVREPQNRRVEIVFP